MGSRAAASAWVLVVCACSTQSAVPVPGDLQIRVTTDLHTLLSHVHPVPEEDEVRSERLRAMFESVGCPKVEQVSARGSDLHTVSCSLPGASNLTVVVGATFDEPLRGTAGDDWPSAAMLPSLYRALRADEREHTFEFVAFVGGKRKRPGHGTSGGARFFLEQLTDATRRRTIALVSLNGFGSGFGHGPIGVWESQADPNLRLDLRSVTKALDLPTRKVTLKKYPAGNPFLIGQPSVPSIYLFVADPVRGDFVGEYLDSYRILSFYLGYVDQTLALRREGRASAIAAAADGGGEGEDEGEGADGPHPQDAGEHQGGEGNGVGAVDPIAGQDQDEGGVAGAGSGDRDR